MAIHPKGVRWWGWAQSPVVAGLLRTNAKATATQTQTTKTQTTKPTKAKG
jgi:hypothetical protein